MIVPRLIFSKVESVESYTLKCFYRQTPAEISKHSPSHLWMLWVLYFSVFSTGAVYSGFFVH